ncbi:hypothetical protein OUZ56_007682 [Daphnia magna]|uniref:Uncharacterized protein n=1 Tax=Daphnia magna TaxID=35525 RepID=A0ABR0AAP6_9CRUS|nr:hypothetical protein OUZ56_007682 [Daphnia magna]
MSCLLAVRAEISIRDKDMLLWDDVLDLISNPKPSPSRHAFLQFITRKKGQAVDVFDAIYALLPCIYSASHERLPFSGGDSMLITASATFHPLLRNDVTLH